MSYSIDTSHLSPNRSPRGGVDISMIVMHATVGGYAASLAWLCNPASKVSTHYLIRKDGYIAQLVPDAQQAWHAGTSAWHGVTNINAHSLGIELENANDGHDPYPPAQIAAAHWLCQDKIAHYNIERLDVVRHLDIALPAGRKTDPAPPAFPWPSFANSLYLDVPPTYPRFVVVAPCAVFTSRAPDAPLSTGPDNGQTHLAVGDIINVGQQQDGWLWVSDSATTAPGIGFLPQSYARPV